MIYKFYKDIIILIEINHSAHFHLDITKAKLLFKKHLNEEINISKEIWKWIHLELWFRHFIDERIETE